MEKKQMFTVFAVIANSVLFGKLTEDVLKN